MSRTAIFAGALIALSAARGRAQQWQGDVHGIYARTTQTHQNSWGGGVQVQATLGSQQSPVQVGMSVAGDGTKQENNGPTNWSVSYDLTVQPGGSSMFTPYVGGSVGANWFSGSNAPSGSFAGYQYIVGVQYKPNPQGLLAVKLEVRPGYVISEEHTVTWRLALAHSL